MNDLQRDVEAMAILLLWLDVRIVVVVVVCNRHVFLISSGGENGGLDILFADHELPFCAVGGVDNDDDKGAPQTGMTSFAVAALARNAEPRPGGVTSSVRHSSSFELHTNFDDGAFSNA